MKQMVSRTLTRDLVILSSFALFVTVSLWFRFEPGEIIGRNFIGISIGMLKVLPCAFILIALFDVWVKGAIIQNHTSGLRGFVFAVLLASTTVGGLLVAFPVAHSLRAKGVRPSVIFAYLFAAGICRLPMTVFEASFLGVKFTLIRLTVSLPLALGASILLARYARSAWLDGLTEVAGIGP